MTYHLTGPHYMERFISLIAFNSIDWSNLQDWRLWLLVIGATNGTADDRLLFIEPILETMQALGIDSWEQVMEILTDFCWVDEVFRPKTLELGREVVARAALDYDVRSGKTPRESPGSS